MKVAIVVTAANEAQAESCQKELDGRKDLADFLEGKRRMFPCAPQALARGSCTRRASDSREPSRPSCEQALLLPRHQLPARHPVQGLVAVADLSRVPEHPHYIGNSFPHYSE